MPQDCAWMPRELFAKRRDLVILWADLVIRSAPDSPYHFKQQEIGERLGWPRKKISRMLASLHASGLCRVEGERGRNGQTTVLPCPPDLDAQLIPLDYRLRHSRLWRTHEQISRWLELLSLVDWSKPEPYITMPMRQLACRLRQSHRQIDLILAIAEEEGLLTVQQSAKVSSQIIKFPSYAPWQTASGPQYISQNNDLQQKVGIYEQTSGPQYTSQDNDLGENKGISWRDGLKGPDQAGPQYISQNNDLQQKVGIYEQTAGPQYTSQDNDLGENKGISWRDGLEGPDQAGPHFSTPNNNLQQKVGIYEQTSGPQYINQNNGLRESVGILRRAVDTHSLDPDYLLEINNLTGMFELFLREYIGRPGDTVEIAAKTWNQSIRNEEEARQAVIGAMHYSRHMRRMLKRGEALPKYILSARTFLRERRYLDYQSEPLDRPRMQVPPTDKSSADTRPVIRDLSMTEKLRQKYREQLTQLRRQLGKERRV